MGTNECLDTDDLCEGGPEEGSECGVEDLELEGEESRVGVEILEAELNLKECESVTF